MSRSFHNEARFDRAPRLPRYIDGRTQIAEALIEVANDPSIARLAVGHDTDIWLTGPAWLDDCQPNDKSETVIAYTSETPRTTAQLPAKPAEGTRVKARVQHLQPRRRRMSQEPGPLYGVDDCWREQTSRRTSFSVCV